MDQLPGAAFATRPLHFIWILDTSSSMTGEKIGQLNFAIKEALSAMQDAARDNPEAELLIRAVTFSTGAHWHIAQPTPVDALSWPDIIAGGARDLGAALTVVADELRVPPMPRRALPPCLVLVTDGSPTDDFDAGLAGLVEQPWGRKAVRIAIGMGPVADADVLRRFIGHAKISPLRADNSTSLIKFVRWLSEDTLDEPDAVDDIW